jgi:putative transposase
MWVRELPDLKVADLQKEFKRTFVDQWESLDAAGRRMKEQFLNEVLEVERTEFLDRQSYERLLEGSCYRNGYWTRYIVLKEGRLKLRMPRLRGGQYTSILL